LLARVEALGLDNVRIHPDDARAVIAALPAAVLGRLFVLFPDPWPKARHHRRRFIGPENLPEIVRVLADGAELRTATDDAGYLDWMREHLGACPELVAQPAGRPADGPATRYEAKALTAGRRSVFLSYRRRAREQISPSGHAMGHAVGEGAKRDPGASKRESENA
jgi:tRNA (guanine-N7-)-methyltransferase